jgi:hypothetical protein
MYTGGLSNALGMRKSEKDDVVTLWVYEETMDGMLG